MTHILMRKKLEDAQEERHEMTHILVRMSADAQGERHEMTHILVRVSADAQGERIIYK
jgi:hypothetical protein